MQEIDINNLIDENNYLNKNIPNNIIIVGEIRELNIFHKYDKLDLSRIECNAINYQNQEGESIKNHLLPNSLQILVCFENKLSTLVGRLNF